MTRASYFARIVLFLLFLSGWSSLSSAQHTDYGKAMDEIMESFISDYPEPTIKAFDKLFAGTNVDELPATTRFFYYYYYGNCIADSNPEKAIEYFTQARTVAYSFPEVGIRNSFALDAEKALAVLYMAKGTEEYVALAMLLYNDIITVGISLLDNPDIGGLVVQSLIEEARLGVRIWEDPEWVKKIWIQARDLALELNQGDYYSYYVLSVLRYYCDLGDYDTALSFMEDAKNKEILEVDASSFIKHIQDTKQLLSQTESIISSKGNHSLEYWTNQLEIATLSTAICSELLQEVEIGLVANDLTESYEYAQVLFLLSNNTFKHPVVAEKYFIKQIEVLEKTPQYFAYITDTDVYNSLAVCQMKQGKYDMAQENYQKALKCLERDSSYSDQPGYQNVLATVYHNLGRNLYFLGNYKESVEYYTKSIVLQEEANGTIMPKTRVYMSESQEQIARTK